MKALTEKHDFVGANAWGRDSAHQRQTFEIEAGDVGHARDNYLGYGKSGHAFKPSDVGRSIMVYTDGTGWTCWSW